MFVILSVMVFLYDCGLFEINLNYYFLFLSFKLYWDIYLEMFKVFFYEDIIGLMDELEKI